MFLFYLGHMSRECPTKKSGTTCFNCNEEGHMSRECPSKKQGGFRGGNKSMTCFKCNEEGKISY